MELLRLQGVENLGAIRRAYLEASGPISVFPMQIPKLGLPIVPPVDCGEENRADTGRLCCKNCGNLNDTNSACPECGSYTRLDAVLAERW